MKAENREIKDAGPGLGGCRAVTTPQTKGMWEGSAFQNPTRGSCRKGHSERSNGLPWRDGQAAETWQEGSQERKYPNFTLHPSMFYWGCPLAERPRGQTARKNHGTVPAAPGVEGPQGIKGQFPAQGNVTSVFSRGLQSSTLDSHCPLETKEALEIFMGLKSARIRLESLNPGPATCRLDRLLTLLHSMRAGTMMFTAQFENASTWYG